MLVTGLYIKKKLKEILKRKRLNTNKERAYRKILRSTKNIWIKKIRQLFNAVNVNAVTC